MRNDESLTNLQDIVMQVVTPFNGRDGRVVDLRKLPEALAWLDVNDEWFD